MKKLIYLEDAIDAIYEAFCYAYCDNCEKNLDEDLCGDCHRKYQNWSASKKTIEKVINALPSAQPEIIRCKNCKHWNELLNICDRTKRLALGVNGFCSRAERKDNE